jgi:L-ascorbate metabolism protein UlaG (beta-lactamase superfamily)
MRTWLAAAAVAALATGVTADTIPTSGGPIELTPMVHAHVQIQFGGKVIQVDPTSMTNPEAPRAADLVLVTDIHPDHMDAASIERMRKPTTRFVAPPALKGRFPGETTILANGDTAVVDGISIQAVAAYNLTRGPAAGQLYHPKGRGNAYVLTLGGTRILLTGDTECTPELKALTGIDVAFVAMNLPFTMTPQEAADCVRAFKPAIVYPYHYRQDGLVPPGKNRTDFLLAMAGATGIEVRSADFYPPPPGAPGFGGAPGK